MPDKLTDCKIKALKQTTKPYTVRDGAISGLILAVSTTGKKVFRLKYKFQGKAQQLTLGPYPEVCLIYAREIALEARRLLHQDTTAAAKQAEKANVSAPQEKIRT